MAQPVSQGTELSRAPARDRLARLGVEDGEHQAPDRRRRISPSPPKPAATTMQAALLRPFHWHDDFITMELPVDDGEVQRDPDRNVTKFAIVDRFSGEAQDLPHVLARLRPAHAGHGGRLHGRARQAQSLDRRLVGRGHGDGGEPRRGDRRRLGSGQRRQDPGRGALRDRRADDAASRRRARCRDAAALRGRRKRSNGSTSPPSRRAGIRAFPSGCSSRR